MTITKIHKGKLQKKESGWVINHNLIDPYGQIPNPLPVHPDIKIEDDSDGNIVDYEVSYEYYAKIKKTKKQIYGKDD